MITAIKLLRVMHDEGKSLTTLTEGFSRYPQTLVNIRVKDKVPFETIPAVYAKSEEIVDTLGDRGRLLLRYSGTEALARVMIEGENAHQVHALADELAAIIKNEIGVTNTVA
jgi:phosphoglucosamine mutase